MWKNYITYNKAQSIEKTKSVKHKILIRWNSVINVNKNHQRGHQERTIQRHRQHWAQDTERRQTKDNAQHRKLKKMNKKKKQGESRYSRIVTSPFFL